MKFFFRKNIFFLVVLGILFLAIVLRFYNYPNRWGLAYDQAHDAIIAKYALDHSKVPLLGPFSSAGPFQTGGEWYWFIMLGTLLFPFTLMGPWIFLTLTQVLFVWIVILVGVRIGGKVLGFIAGLLSAISPAGIAQSTNLTNQAPINLFSIFSILAVVLYKEQRKGWQMFLLGLSVGTAISIHLQGAALGILAVISMLVLPVRNLKHILALIAGGILPLLPIFIIDIPNHFFNTKGFLQYYLHDQYKIPLDQFGRNWHTYILQFWPNALGSIVGGNKVIGIFVAFIVLVSVSYALIKKLLSRVWIVLFVSMFGFFVMLRYLHTPLFDSYLMFFHPFLFLVVGYAIYTIFSKQNMVGIVILVVLVIGSLYKDGMNILSATNYAAQRSFYWSNFIAEKYPKKKFFLYDYKNRSGAYTYPLLLYMQKQDLLDENGYRISFGWPSYRDDPINYNALPPILGNKMGFLFVDVQSSSSAELIASHFTPIYPKGIYESTEEWYKNK